MLNAAVILKDPRRSPQTIQAIEAAGKRDGLPLKAISWQEASGFIGQMVVAFQAVLLVLVLIIFLVALVIISNALVMATLAAGAGDRHAAGGRRPAALHPGDAGDRGASWWGSSSAAWAPGSAR